MDRTRIQESLGENLPARPESINWHVTVVCNYACRFCFLTLRGYRRSLPPGSPLRISPSKAVRVLRLLADAGTQKLTFAGGEPTLCPELPELVREAEGLGLHPMVVSNGTGITDDFVQRAGPFLSAIKLSIDSASSELEAEMGRGTGNHVATIMAAADRCRQEGIPVMVNTVVSAKNWDEDLRPLIRLLAPVRWKVFQVLPVNGETDAHWRDFSLGPELFAAFVRRHAELNPVAENNEAMRGSYLMIDPLGRFFQDFEGRYRYSQSVLDVGVMPALGQVGWDFSRFVRRGGQYPLPERRIKGSTWSENTDL